LRRLPFDTPVLVQGSGGSAAWVKEGAAKPMTQWTYTRTKRAPLKVAAIAAATQETLMRASAAADVLIRDELAQAIGARIDTTFISDDAAVADQSPAGLLNGTAALTLSGGATVANIRSDIQKFLTTMSEDNQSVAGCFWVMPETVAIALSLVANEVGAPAFLGIGPTGGTLQGLPAFTSQYVPTLSDGPVVALIKGSDIFLGDEGGIQVSVSDQASLSMSDAPTGNSKTPTATSVVSLWETNSVGFRVERFLNWAKRRDSAVAWGTVGWSG
jgi:HK97 family phage major capsid protein